MEHPLTRRLTAIIILLFNSAYAQLVRDTALFTLSLSKDSPAAVSSCSRGTHASGTLCGPVLMAGNSLLLFSSRGYLLLDSTGTVLDSHVVASASQPGLALSFPRDSVTVFYHHTGSPGGKPVRIAAKRLFDPVVADIPDADYRWFGAAHMGTYVNIACMSLMHEETVRLNLLPQVIGFTGLRDGARWWVVDRDSDLRSPIVYRRADGGAELFPGLFESQGVTVAREDAIEVRGCSDSPWGRLYLGVSANVDINFPRCVQVVYLCDGAGNVLRADTLFKQLNEEVPISLQAEGGENVMAFVRDASRLAYPPVMDSRGRLYYGVIELSRCGFRVRRRDYAYYMPVPVETYVAPSLTVERDLAFEPVDINCNTPQQAGATVPRVTFTGFDGARRVARPRELERHGYLARIGRHSLRSLEAKFGRRPPALPTAAERLCDSLQALPAFGCPWVVSLSGPGGYVRTFAYGPDQRVLCARVLGLRPDSTVAVRVDLVDHAEVLLFTSRGAFVNRFTFNGQPWRQRKDIVVLAPTGDIIEDDLEGSGFRAWRAVSP